MSTRSYDRAQAASLLPLLESLACEITERDAVLRRLDKSASALAKDPKANRDELSELRAEIAMHRFEIRRSVREIEELGCSLDEGEPLTIRIPRSPGRPSAFFAWRPSEPGQLLELVDAAAA